MNSLESLNHKLKEHKKIFGFLAQLRDTFLLPAYKRDGVDFIVFDLEHGPADEGQLNRLLQYSRAIDLTTIIRVQDAIYHLISKPIDLGADGIILPRTETLDQVHTAIGALRFAPIGKKGCGGTNQFRPNESFSKFQTDRILLLQIESPLGVQNLPHILEDSGDQIGGIIIGPYDMSVMVGTPLNIHSVEVTEQIDKTVEICNRYNKSVGIFCENEEYARTSYGKGMNILWTGSDIGYLTGGLTNMINKLSDL